MWLTRNDLPTRIKVEDREYSIPTDFRSWIRFEAILNDPEIEPDSKYILIAMSMNLSPQLLKNNEESVMNALFSFYRCFKEPRPYVGSSSNDIAYSYQCDMDLIYAAFRQQYGINLLNADMHWFEYKSLFDSLTDETLFVKVQQYRTQDISKLPKDMQQDARRLKEYWKISSHDLGFKERTPQEIEQEILKRLKVGGVDGSD